MGYLDRTYKDVNRADRATEELRKLRQKEGQYFASFLPSFERTLSDAGGATWPDSARLAFLKGALNTQLSRALIPAQLPVTYADWVLTVQDIAGRVESDPDFRKSARATNAQRNDRGPAAKSSQNTPTKTDGDGDVEMTGINRVKGQKEKSSKQRRPRSDREPPEKSHQSKKEIRCYNCGHRGHVAANCNESSDDAPPTRIKRIRARSSGSKSDTQPSNSEDELQSGKE
jgi:hypothetical protein